MRTTLKSACRRKSGQRAVLVRKSHFVPRTEYGGILNSLEVMTKTQEIVVRHNVEGLLKRKIIEPPEGKDHLTVSGDLNDILRDLIKDRFDGLFLCRKKRQDHRHRLADRPIRHVI